MEVFPLKRFLCIALMLYMLFLTWALADSIPSSSVDSFPGWTFSDFPDMNTDSWFSEMTPPEGWKDLVPDDFGTFPEDWGDFGNMEEWSARFDAFKNQLSGEKENGESSFPDTSDPMENLQNVFSDHLNKNSSDLNQSTEIRNLFTQAFGAEPADQADMPGLPVSREDLDNASSLSTSSLSGQMSTIAQTLGVTLSVSSDQSEPSLESLPDFSSTSSRDLSSIFSEQSGKLQTTMDISSDRYKSLYSIGKTNQGVSAQESRKSLYSLAD